MKPVKKTAAALFRSKRDGSLDEPSRFTSRISAAVAILLGTGLLLYARRLRFISRGELIGAALGLMVILEFATSFAVIRKGTFEKPKV